MHASARGVALFATCIVDQVYSEIADPTVAVLMPLLDGINGRTRTPPHASSLRGASREACPVRIRLPDYLLLP
jgi:L-lactate utilization protein LutB